MTKTFEAEPILAFDPPRPGKRRVFTAEQKRLLLEETERPGESMSSVARRYGIASSLLFHWKRQRDNGAQQALIAGEPVVRQSEYEVFR